jgi:DNA-binding MarR family transcriptional regulator
VDATVNGVDQEVLTFTSISRLLDRARGELTLPQYRLLALMVNGEQRASQLAGQLELAKPTVSATIETLVERGLVERAAVEGDRRAVRLGITPAGRRALRAAEESMRERLDRVLVRVEHPEVVTQALAELAAALEAMRADWIARQRELHR